MTLDIEESHRVLDALDAWLRRAAVGETAEVHLPRTPLHPDVDLRRRMLLHELAQAEVALRSRLSALRPALHYSQG